jgi:RNA ligase
MNFFTYIGMSPAQFSEEYIEGGYVSQQNHAEFPLSIFTYSRKTVQEQKWDAVTSKCRGIVINRETGEIVARPFEKFHNYGSAMDELATTRLTVPTLAEPVIWEKLDGFLSTLYTWQGVDYIASKGSFHSVHAKWATAWLRKKFGASLGVPAGHTAVFEGLHPDLRIVVNYGDRKELVLLAVIDNETGEEFSPGALLAFADSKGLAFPKLTNKPLKIVHEYSLRASTLDEEGFVLTWYQKGQPPFRLKLKFIEYLRLHRIVTGVSPKRIWEVLAGNQTSELDEYLKQSTPWFSKFVQKWMTALNSEYGRIESEGNSLYQRAQLEVERAFPDGFKNLSSLHRARRTFAETATKSELAGVAFAMLDGKDPAPVIWKIVKHMTHGHNPLVDAHT